MDDLYYDVFETSWGWVGAAGSDRGIRCSSLPEPTPERAVEQLTAAAGRGLPAHRPGAFDAFRRQLEEYFSGRRSNCDVVLDLDGASEFFRRAWEACRAIPPGQTRSYRWLAEQAGRPAAARGAGQAMARNRVPIVIPCHRVIGSDGGLHGFGGGGLALKERLLRLEGARPTGAAGRGKASGYAAAVGAPSSTVSAPGPSSSTMRPSSSLL